MKYFYGLIAFLLFVFNHSYAQENIGAIKTNGGFLLYNSSEPAFTVDLIGAIDLSNYPTISINGNLMEFTFGPSVSFGNQDKEILLNYMKWESDYLTETFEKPIKTHNEFTNTNGVLVNSWNFINPALTNENTQNKKQFYADFHKGENVYRLSFLSFNGSDKAAKENLLIIINHFRFYNERIDVTELSKSISSNDAEGKY